MTYQRPETPAERQRRDAAQQEKLAALHERLAHEVRSLRTGEDWRRWLEVARRLPSYSFGNVLLIAAQKPDATAVAGYSAWKGLGRQVKKGERGIQILAPVVRRGPAEPEADDMAQTSRSGAGDLDTWESRQQGQLVGFRLAHVWDVSQTSGQPVPEQPRPQLLAGQAPDGLWGALADLAAARGFAVQRGECGRANGYTDYAARLVRVRDDVDDAQVVKTLAHELGHVLLHVSADFAAANTTSCRGVQEVEAESVAYLVAATHGLATGGYTFPYVTGWAATVSREAPEQVVRDTGQRVLRAASAVLAPTRDQPAPPVDADLMAAVEAGRQRAASARKHAGTTLAAAAQHAAAVVVPLATDVEVLAELNALAAAFYVAELHRDTPAAREASRVLSARAIPSTAITAYELGYAPAGWTVLTEHLRQRGFSDDQLLAAGLAIRTRRGGLIDRFRDRIMFPVRDSSGDRVVGFLGRTLGEPKAGEPKYLNSPETALYRKGELLYGLRQARGDLASASPVLVEGPLDAIAVTASGVGRYVGLAPCGTALTPGQVALVAQLTATTARDPIVAFDNDLAGRAASLRVFPVLLGAGAWPTLARLPEGIDPAALLQQKGVAAVAAALDSAAQCPLADIVIDARLDEWAGRLQWPEGRLGAAREVATVVATLPPEHIARQVVRTATRIGIGLAAMTREVVDAIADESKSQRGVDPGRRAPSDSPSAPSLLHLPNTRSSPSSPLSTRPASYSRGSSARPGPRRH